jgi:hypothetical protein
VFVQISGNEPVSPQLPLLIPHSLISPQFGAFSYPAAQEHSFLPLTVEQMLIGSAPQPPLSVAHVNPHEGGVSNAFKQEHS